MSTGRRHAGRILLIGLGVAALIGAVTAAAYPLWWGHRATTTSQALLRQAGVPAAKVGRTTPRATPHAAAQAAAPATSPAPGCLTASPTAVGDPAPSGVLQIPSLSLTAPVVDGLTDSVLNVAVGHDPSSPWPGAVGESILEAHDVSFFSHLDQLGVGQLVTWEAGCSDSTFRVTGATVMQPGDPVPDAAGGTGLALVTCWPTDALWWTSQRYVVTTALVSTTLVKDPSNWPDPAHAAFTVPASPSLASGGLGLTTNSVSLGTLQLAGTPSPTWASSPAPLQVANAALQEYVAARRAVNAQDPSWWASIAIPGVAMPGRWSEAGPLSVTLFVTGTHLNTVILASGAASLELSPVGRDIMVAQASST